MNLPILYTFFSHGASTKFNTSMLTILMGISIGLAIIRKQVFSGFLGAILLIFCIFTLLQYLFGLNLPVDELFMSDNLTDPHKETPGRMSLYTTISFLFTALGLELYLTKKYSISQILTSIGFVMAYLSLIGILFNISSLFSFGSYSAVALPTALGLTSASIGILFFTSDRGWLSEFASKHSAAVTTRYLLLYFFLSLPLFIGFFLLMLSKAKFPAEFATVLLIVGYAVLTLPFAIILLRKLNRSDEMSWELMRELEQRSEELFVNNNKLEMKNKQLDSLIHIISHDLKTPITSLQGSMSIMEKKLAPVMQTQDLQLFTISKRSIKTLAETITNLGEIIRTKQLEENKIENIDLCGLVNKIISQLDATIKNTNAVVTVDIDDCYIFYEQIHLHSIIQNLVTNALKYHHPGRAPLIEISSQKLINGVRLDVKDNGLGIPENQKKNLFNKYSRFHEHIEGTGVGLYLVRQLLGGHGGSIDVVSEEDKGTTFTIFLPSGNNAVN
ncbi:HAMP domain-containing sensor histidine kinase [Pedobacter agri]|uniref:histidine kinase n=2 Tax=Pedobacter agri TaxID=454586 RepID=A0A9X3DEV6_9SPHI|nr:HAMP domain-containing sensor histidine kinase [Pedobacter agri]